MDTPAPITMQQLPFWILALGIIALGGLSLYVGMLPAAVLSLVFLAILSRLPNELTFTFSEQEVTVHGWMDPLPFRSRQTFRRSGLSAEATTHAGEGENCVHTLSLTAGQSSARISGIHCDPKALQALVNALPLPTQGDSATA